MSRTTIALLVAVASIGGAALGSRASAQSAPGYTRCAAVTVPVNTNERKAVERGDYSRWVPLPLDWEPVGGASYGPATAVVIACTKKPPLEDQEWTESPL